MVCPYPRMYTFGSKKIGAIKQVWYPCGKCEVCKDNRLNDWNVRLTSEMSYNMISLFCTFTYDDENLPEDGSLRKTDIQKFFKRFRKNYGLSIKYYYCGEYGEQLGRPHYHCILFIRDTKNIEGVFRNNKEVTIYQMLRETWKMGNVDVGNVTPASIRYCLSYMKKVCNVPDGLNIEEPFHHMSKGVGREYCLKNEDLLSERCYVLYNGHVHKIPKYFKRVSKRIRNSSFKISLKSDLNEEKRNKERYPYLYGETLERNERRFEGPDQTIKNITERNGKKYKRRKL